MKYCTIVFCNKFSYILYDVVESSILRTQDTRLAAEAMTRLQGIMLLSSERGGMRIEFAKHKMGELVSDNTPDL